MFGKKAVKHHNIVLLEIANRLSLTAFDYYNGITIEVKNQVKAIILHTINWCTKKRKKKYVVETKDEYKNGKDIAKSMTWRMMKKSIHEKNLFTEK